MSILSPFKFVSFVLHKWSLNPDFLMPTLYTRSEALLLFCCHNNYHCSYLKIMEFLIRGFLNIVTDYQKLGLMSLYPRICKNANHTSDD